MATIKVSAFRWVPPFAQGLVRDLRVRWALEEAGLAYEERLLSLGEHKSERYCALQPFGQIPSYEEDDLVLFESGAIVLHVAERSEALMSTDPDARAHTKTWIFAALSTVEPPILFFNEIAKLPAGEESAKLRVSAIAMVKARLASLAARLDGRDYLLDRFTAADLLMTAVLRQLRNTELLAEMPVLDAYRLRCEARPAFRKALADQMAPFAENAPPKS